MHKLTVLKYRLQTRQARTDRQSTNTNPNSGKMTNTNTNQAATETDY
jgi:hypothetical protein